MFRGGKVPEPAAEALEATNPFTLYRDKILNPDAADLFGKCATAQTRKAAAELVDYVLANIGDGEPHTIRLTVDIEGHDEKDATRYEVTTRARVDDPADVRAVGDRRQCRMEPAGEYDGRRAWKCDQCGARVVTQTGGPLNAVLYCEQCGARIAN